MKWFKRWLYRAVRDEESQHVPLPDSDTPFHGYGGLQINITPVIGGFIATFRHRESENTKTNTIRDDMVVRHHIIRDDEDFNDAICRLITLESMRSR